MKDKIEDFLELSFSDHINIATESLGSSVPQLAPFITMVNSYKGEMANKRLIKYYEELNMKLNRIEVDIRSIKDKNKKEISLIFEKLSELAMKDIKENKRTKFVNYFVKVILDAMANELSYDKVELYLQLLETMTDLEFKILGKIYIENEINSSEIEIKDVNSLVVLGTLDILKNRGLLTTGEHVTVKFTEKLGHYHESDFRLSELGESFVRYIFN